MILIILTYLCDISQLYHKENVYFIISDGKVFYEKENRGSKVALDIPCDEAYEFDKFDRFFSAFDFFREPPPVSVKKTGGGISRTGNILEKRKRFGDLKFRINNVQVSSNND